MVRRTSTFLLLLLMSTAVSTFADEYAPVPTQPVPGTTPGITSPPGPVYSLGMPSPQRLLLDAVQSKHQGPHGAGGQQAAPAAGWTGYGFGGVPTYQWGYFGARYRPVKIYHQGYYGHQMSYGYRRGY